MTAVERRRLTLAGAGIRGRGQLTLDCLARLRAADEVLFFPVQDVDETWLELTVGAQRTRDLSALYEDGGVDRSNYERVKQAVVGSLDQFRDVVLLMPGHPALGVTVSAELQTGLGDGVHVDVLDGISSWDTVISDLRIDPLARGTAVVDANRLLLYKQTVEPALDLLVYHVCSIGTMRTHISTPALENSLHLLKDHLLATRPADTDAVLVESQRCLSRDAIRWEGQLGTLDQMLPAITFGTTLFVRGVPAQANGRDAEFLRLLKRR